MGSLKAIKRFANSLVEPVLPVETVEMKGPNFPNIGTAFSSLASGDTRSMEHPYEQHLWVYACIRRIYDALTALPLRMCKGPDEDFEQVRDSDLERLLSFPSPQVNTPEQLWQLTDIHLDTKGKAFWVKVKGDGGVSNPWEMPDRLIVVNPDMMTPITQNNWLMGWKYRTGQGKSLTLMDYEVIFFKFPHPRNPWDGLAPLAAAMMGIQSDYLAQKYNEAFFKNAGIVSGFLQFQDAADPKVLRQLKRKFQEEHGGARNAYKVMVLEQGTTWNDAKTTQKDMEFLEQRRWNREEIISAFSCNKHVLGLTDDYNKANSQEAEKSFHTRAVRPRALMLCSTLWGQWLRFRKEQTWLWFDDSNLECLQADRRELGLILGNYLRAGVPLKEANRVLGLGLDLDGNKHAETVWIAKGLIPAELAEQGDISGGGGGGEAGAALQAPPETKALKEPPPPSPAPKPKPIIPKVLFDEKAFANDLNKLLKAIFKQAVDMGISQLEDEGIAIGFDPAESIRFRRFFDNKELLIKTIPERFHKNVRKWIRRDIREGMTVKDIADHLEERFKISKKGWSMTIARTEVGDVIDNTRMLAMEEEEVPYHAWLSAHDGAVRDSHKEGSWGKNWVEVGKPFENGLTHPHDPSAGPSQVCNCRCVTLPLDEKPGEDHVKTAGEWDARIKSISEPLEKKAFKRILPLYGKVLKEILKNFENAN